MPLDIKQDILKWAGDPTHDLIPSGKAHRVMEKDMKQIWETWSTW